jgi:hypothetical protein
VELGESLPQKFEPLAGKIGLLVRHSSDVAAGLRQTSDQVATDRVDPQWKDDGDDRCRLLYCGSSGSIRDNDIGIQADKLGCDSSVALGPSLRPAILNRDGATLNPAEFTQSLHKCSSPGTLFKTYQIRASMSALGQKQTSDCRPLMSALPPKADIRRHNSDVRFVPKVDICVAILSL